MPMASPGGGCTSRPLHRGLFLEPRVPPCPRVGCARGEAQRGEAQQLLLTNGICPAHMLDRIFVHDYAVGQPRIHREGREGQLEQCAQSPRGWGTSDRVRPNRDRTWRSIDATGAFGHDRAGSGGLEQGRRSFFGNAGFGAVVSNHASGADFRPLRPTPVGFAGTPLSDFVSIVPTPRGPREDPLQSCPQHAPKTTLSVAKHLGDLSPPGSHAARAKTPTSDSMLCPTH